MDNPVSALVKEPTPVPSDVWVFDSVGPEDVFQHTPRAVTADPPSELIIPMHVAVVSVILPATTDAVTVGTLLESFTDVLQLIMSDKSTTATPRKQPELRLIIFILFPPRKK